MASKEKKYLTWYDINRILRGMESPSLGDPLRADRLKEYYACIGAFLRLCAHFEKIYRDNPHVFRDRPYREVKGFVQAIGEAVATVGEITAEIFIDSLGGESLQ